MQLESNNGEAYPTTLIIHHLHQALFSHLLSIRTFNRLHICVSRRRKDCRTRNTVPCLPVTILSSKPSRDILHTPRGSTNDTATFPRALDHGRDGDAGGRV